MSSSSSAKLYHANRYTAESACAHCHGIVRHEGWCITRNAAVYEAYECVLDDSKLPERDRLILHALGVSWKNLQCQGLCRPAERAEG